MITIGINAYHPDASIAVVKDGALIWAAEEERYTRLKHQAGFPTKALQAAISENDIDLASIDAVCLAKNSKANLLRKIHYALANRSPIHFIGERLQALGRSQNFENDFKQALANPKNLHARFLVFEHHQCHVASAYYLSGFKRAAFLSIDGLGDFSSAMWGLGNGLKLNIQGRVYFPHSAGFLYTAATQFLGFYDFGDEYKVMGLAAFGKPTYEAVFKEMVRLLPDGRFELNLDFFRHHKGKARVQWVKGKPRQETLYSDKWIEVFGPARSPEEPVTERDKNLAASLQAVLEQIYLHVLNHLQKATQSENLCLAGGVAFNSVANGRITADTDFKNVFIQPAAGDAGTAVGAALLANLELNKTVQMTAQRHAFLGTGYRDEEIEKFLTNKKVPYQKLDQEALLQRTVTKLINNGVVGWFQGRMEMGPRALGNRSILADPRNQNIQDLINEKIKRREMFRPFAPAVIEERAQDYFEMRGESSPYMLKVYPVKEDKKNVIPAVTHVDGSARVQTVSKEQHPLFFALLSEFDRETGVPVLLNTSFNEKEPIVCSPEDAFACFEKTNMDALVMGSYFIER